MPYFIAVNASPRSTGNTAALVRSAAEGARDAGAEVEIVDLYDIGAFTGCVSCFGCKLGRNRGRCILQDGLSPLLEKIRKADGLILGTPNYLGEASAAFRALYERLIFQFITYNKDRYYSNDHRVPVLFIMTSNEPDEAYQPGGSYCSMIQEYQKRLDRIIGPTTLLIVGDTRQVSDYSLYDWSLFDAEAKMERHNTVFPEKRRTAREIGHRMARKENNV